MGKGVILTNADWDQGCMVSPPKLLELAAEEG